MEFEGRIYFSFESGVNTEIGVTPNDPLRF